MAVKTIKKVFLTFDIEDFINDRSIGSLFRILGLLKKYSFEGLFFITGNMAKKLYDFPAILDILKSHAIGYHSSSHSVRPTIPEYTDIKNYEKAYLLSLKRETAYINPLNGEPEGKGGIEFLIDLFPKKNIIAFRAPGCCWSPPNLEALVKLGIKFDFSAYISTIPIYYKDVTFYPYPIYMGIYVEALSPYRFLCSILKNKVTVLGWHPSDFVNKKFWDTIYLKGNPQKLYKVDPKTVEQTKFRFKEFELLLKWIKILGKLNLIKVTTDLEKGKNMTITKEITQKSYKVSIYWAENVFGYKPKFLRSHFLRYFEITD